MSIASELKKRGGHRVRVRAVTSNHSNSGGERMKLLLKPVAPAVPRDAFEVARLLVRAGLSVRMAKRTIEDLARGKMTCVDSPAVSNFDLLTREMAKEGVAVCQLKLRTVDVRALRGRLEISQEAFADRYCLDVATVRNWEQGRTKPEGPAATLLHVIDRDPHCIVELLASCPTTVESDVDMRVGNSILGSRSRLVVDKYGEDKLNVFTSQLSRERRLFRFSCEEV